MGGSNKLCSHYDVKKSNQSLDDLNSGSTQRLQHGPKMNQMQWEAIINFASEYNQVQTRPSVYNLHP